MWFGRRGLLIGVLLLARRRRSGRGSGAESVVYGSNAVDAGNQCLGEFPGGLIACRAGECDLALIGIRCNALAL